MIEKAVWPDAWRVWNDARTRFCYVEPTAGRSVKYLCPPEPSGQWKIWRWRPYEASRFVDGNLLDALTDAAALVKDAD